MSRRVAALCTILTALGCDNRTGPGPTPDAGVDAAAPRDGGAAPRDGGHDASSCSPCASPPLRTCVDDTLRVFAAEGQCTESGCEYPSTDTPCPSGCAFGACAPADGIVDIATARDHTCALRSTGSVACWGESLHGRLGDGTVETVFSREVPDPVAVADLADAVQLSAGAVHTCARRATGGVSCWGINGGGQLGDGTRSTRFTPVDVVGLSDAVQVAAGDGHTCALRASGAVACWGDNQYGQLGDGTTTPSTSPVIVQGLGDVVGIAAGPSVSCAIREGGQASCWGRNEEARLGDGTEIDRHQPVEVSGVTDAVQIDIGTWHACAVRSTGAVACWGSNLWGGLGDGTIMIRRTPVPVMNLDDALLVAVGQSHTCAIRASGATDCWGLGGVWRLLGVDEMGERHTPGVVPGLIDAIRLEAGYEHTCALHATGAVSCWGRNAESQLGARATTSHVPEIVPGL